VDAATDSSSFLSRLLLHCVNVRSVWSVGHDRLELQAPHEGRELLVFADGLTLHKLRKDDHLHRADLQLCVVFDGDRFESAWGPQRVSGSLARWAWREIGRDVAYYDESKWAEGDGDASAVVRVRRKAFLLWSSLAALQ
jgi:hypothetical protein